MSFISFKYEGHENVVTVQIVLIQYDTLHLRPHFADKKFSVDWTKILLRWYFYFVFILCLSFIHHCKILTLKTVVKKMMTHFW